MMDLGGKYALITGGASGIGFAIAKILVKNGAKVWVCDVDRDLVASINSASVEINAIAADAGIESEVDQMFDRVYRETGGKLDILVNNAGISGPNSYLENIELDDWTETIRVNLTGTFLCTRRALLSMKAQQSGSIVNLSSSAGLHGYPTRIPYASAKWGIVGFTKSLAMEVGDFGIRVNAICPGAVSGPRMDRVIADEAKTRNLPPEKIREQFVQNTSLKCFVEAEDIAQMVLFICSEQGAKISGQALSVDGYTESLSQIN